MKAEGLAILGVEKNGRADGRQAPDHLRQRPARHQDPQPLPDRDPGACRAIGRANRSTGGLPVQPATLVNPCGQAARPSAPERGWGQ